MYIIARHNEDISWSTDVEKFVVQKDEHLPNVGREASSYLWYITNHYDTLSGEYTFVQAKKHEHLISSFNYNCDLNGNPHHAGLNIKPFTEKLNLEIPETLHFTAGAQFNVTTDQIKQRTLDWYKNAYNISMEVDQAPWILERLWKYIFNL